MINQIKSYQIDSIWTQW